MLRALELRVPPVAVVFIAGALMWGIARLLPSLTVLFPGRVLLAFAAVVAGAFLSAAGVAQFKRASTTVNPMTPGASSSLVVSGVYRWTRNPMYLGFLVALAGWAVYLANAGPFLVLPAFVLYMGRFQIEPEERALAARFGDQFEAYRRAVRRWL